MKTTGAFDITTPRLLRELTWTVTAGAASYAASDALLASLPPGASEIVERAGELHAANPNHTTKLRMLSVITFWRP
jgi:hypothetical protein